MLQVLSATTLRVMAWATFTCAESARLLPESTLIFASRATLSTAHGTSSVMESRGLLRVGVEPMLLLATRLRSA